MTRALLLQSPEQQGEVGSHIDATKGDEWMFKLQNVLRKKNFLIAMENGPPSVEVLLDHLYCLY